MFGLIKRLYGGARGRFHRMMPLLYFGILEPYWKRFNSYYDFISERELKERKSSDTVFVFGSGYSINDITKKQWKEISRHDTLAFNLFFKGKFAPIDFHIVRETECRKRPLFLRPDKFILRYARGIKSNPFYRNTIFIANRNVYPPAVMLFGKLLPKKAKVFLYSNASVSKEKKREPGKSFSEIMHVVTLNDAVNVAYLLGYKKIVLAGVDLYDSRYFWLPKDRANEWAERVGRKWSDPLHIVEWGIVDDIGRWNKFLKKKGVELYVLNSRSLLNKHLRVWKFRG